MADGISRYRGKDGDKAYDTSISQGAQRTAVSQQRLGRHMEGPLGGPDNSLNFRLLVS